jgi:alkylation response protein AidB-like acyl-CoA dehydrogenase
MNFEWPAELETRVGEARRFAVERLKPYPKASGFDASGFRAAAQFGSFAAPTRTEGAARCRGALAAVALLEAFGQGGADRGLLFALGAHLFGHLVPFVTYASAAQAAKWEAALRSGECIGALAVTEPGGGSSLDNIKTQAVPAQGGYALTGKKTLIGNAPHAGLIIVLARQDGRAGPLGLTAFLLPSATPGLSATPLPHSAGLAGAALGEVTLDGCVVPQESVLGQIGAGFRVFATAMQWERSCLLAGFLGRAERDLATWQSSLEARRDGEGTVLRHQAVSHRLARAKLALEGARLHVYRAACALDDGREDLALAAMAKLAASEAVVQVAEDGVRLMAGMGWQGHAGDPVAALADALGGLSASGTSEIQLEILARQLRSERAAP